MSLRRVILYLLLLGPFACKKEAPSPSTKWNGTFYADSVIDSSPVNGFTNNGEITSIEVNSIIARKATDYPNWEYFITEIEADDSIQINATSAIMDFSDGPVTYNYSISEDLIIMESQDTIHSSLYAFDKDQKSFYSSLCQYPFPDSKVVSIPTPTGFSSTSLFVDEKYVEEIDENTLRVPFVLFLNLVDDLQKTPGFWHLVSFNNRFNYQYSIINTNDTLLVREFDIQYKRKLPL